MPSRLIFIDSQVTDHQTLINQLPQQDAAVVLINSNQDGVTQILAALRDKIGLDTIDIISHGTPGSLLLGSEPLNSDNLADYAGQLAAIGASLNDSGDILLYGCEVAKGKIGQAFIEQFSLLVGANVAASTTLTGATEMAGDWILDAHIGSIGAKAMEFNYNGVLADDYPDTNSTTGFVTIGGNSSGILETEFDHDWFRVLLTEGQKYEFRIVSEGLKPFLTLYDSNEEELDSDASGDGFAKPLIIFTASYTGPYYLEASGYIGRSFEPLPPTTSYTISAILSEEQDESGNNGGVVAPTDDYSASTNTTGFVSIDRGTNGNIETSSDSDWFKISLTAAQIYEFRLNSESIDSFLTLYDSHGNPIIDDNDGGEGTNSLITYTALSSDLYFLEAKGYGSDQIGGYTITAIQSGVLPDDYTDTIATTGLLTIGGNTSGIIEEIGDRDWFQTSLIAGESYTFQVTSEEIIPFISLYDAEGNFINDNYLQAARSGGDLDFTATDSGTYYVGVHDAVHTILRSYTNEPGDATGYYTISLLEDFSSLFASDRIFNWAESLFPELLPNHTESIEISGYYARVYDNGNAIGERDDNLYFYNGDSINLVGTVNDFLSDAISAGF